MHLVNPYPSYEEVVLKRSGHQGVLVPLVVILGMIALFAYGTVGLISQDPLWFLSTATVPAPRRIVIRVDGEETLLVASSLGYESLVEATRVGLSAFKSWGLGSMGLSPSTLAEFHRQGTVLELYFAEPVDFHLPFNDGNPTALLIPIEGRYGGEGHVFRGKHGRWWAGQLTMKNPQPILNALSALGYIQP
jgi:hypothetical protein